MMRGWTKKTLSIEEAFRQAQLEYRKTGVQGPFFESLGLYQRPHTAVIDPALLEALVARATVGADLGGERLDLSGLASLKSPNIINVGPVSITPDVTWAGISDEERARIIAETVAEFEAQLRAALNENAAHGVK